MENRGGKREGAGRKKTGNVQKPYYTDLKMHATINQLVTARKSKELTDEALSRVEQECLKGKNK